MALMLRWRVDLGSWGAGPPGVMVLHTTSPASPNQIDLEGWASVLDAALNEWKAFFINGMTAQVNTEVTQHDVGTGLLQQVFTVASTPAKVGAGVGTSLPRYVQACARHFTGIITEDKGKRLAGRSFLGPVSGDAIGTSGALTPSAQTAFAGGWENMSNPAAGIHLAVWHRYRKPGTIDAADPGTVGVLGSVIATTVNSKAAVLRSRRD